MKHALLAAAILSAAGTLNATPITFAQFKQDNESQKIFQFTNLPGTNGSFTASGAVRFSFAPGSAPGIPAFDNRPAFLSMTSSTSAAVESGFGLLFQQVLGGSLTIYDNNHASGPILLRATFGQVGNNADSGGRITGARSATSGSLSASEDMDVVTFYSDFFDTSYFNNSRAFSVSLSAITAALHVSADGTNLADFTASGTGTFSADHSRVPEPASLALTGGALLAIGLFTRRKRA